MKKIYTLPKEKYIHLFPSDQYFSSDFTSDVKVIAFQAGEWLIEEGINSNYLYYIIEGKAKIFVTYQNGKVSLLNLIGVHDFIGEMELLHEDFYSKAVQALTDMTVFALPIQLCKPRLLEDVKFLREIAIFISKKAMNVSAKYTLSLAFPLENRLAEFILQTANNGIYKEKHVIVADYLGVSYRHLLYTLAQFVENEILSKKGRLYVIENEIKLVELANKLK